MIIKGAKPLVDSTNRPIVGALREVAAAKVKFSHPGEKEAQGKLPEKISK
jgi:DNA-directed RNA polymerase subunit K/omega